MGESHGFKLLHAGLDEGVEFFLGQPIFVDQFVECLFDLADFFALSVCLLERIKEGVHQAVALLPAEIHFARELLELEVSHDFVSVVVADGSCNPKQADQSQELEEASSSAASAVAVVIG